MSGIDTSIYQNLLRPPKSVAEYDAEAMQNQTNRLALQMGQQKADEYTRGLADQNALRGIVSQFGEDKTANYNALLRGGQLGKAQEYAKQNADIDKTGADVKHLAAQTDETHMKAVNLKMTQAKDFVGMLQTPEQAAQWVRSMYADPDLGKVMMHGGDTPEAAIARIPTDPKAFAQWKMQASLGADKLIEYTTPNANTVANNKTSVETAGISAAASKYSADSNAKTAANRLGFDKEQAKTSDDAAMDPIAIRMTAQQYLAGDSGALSNFGRGAQGAANLNAVRLEVAKQATAAGLSGADIAAKMAEFGGVKAGQRTAGTRSASIEIAANEAAELAPLAVEASRKVARSGFLPFGKAQIMFDQNTNDPALRQFAMANTALANAYSQVMSRGGVASVADKDHARELLSTAHDQPSYEAAVAQMTREIQAAQKAPGAVKAAISSGVSGKDAHGSSGGKVIDFGSLK